MLRYVVRGGRCGRHAGEPAMTAIDVRLLQAYLQTDYIVRPVEGDACPSAAALGGLVLRIGVASAPLADLYRCCAASCAAFITAFNPQSRLTSIEENLTAQARLKAWIDGRHYRYISGVGQHAGSEWPGEPSYLILDLPLTSARALARAYRQNALIWCDGDAVPRLELLR